MGNKNTKESEEAEDNGLSRQQLSQLRELYLQIAESKNEKSHPLTAKLFKSYSERFVDDWLANQVTEYLSVPPNCKQNSSSTSSGLPPSQIIPFANFAHFVHVMLRGEDVDVKVDLIWEILGIQGDTIKADDIKKYVKSIVESYLKMIEKTPNYVSWTSFCERLSFDAIDYYAHFLLSDLFFGTTTSPKEYISKLTSKSPQNEYNKEDLIKWLGSNSQFRTFQAYVFSECFSMDKSLYSQLSHLIPKCIRPLSTPKDSSSFLNILQILFLNSQLTNESLRAQWRLLYSSSVHGTSFAKFLGLVMDRGPSFLIIKEARGSRVFGAFVDSSWKISPKFYGGASCFLFHLDPLMNAYTPTGYNDNYQYLNSNQQTLPNGLGVGGKLNYFGLWLNGGDWGQGKCGPSCTTYSSPQLSTEEEFTFADLEVWGVGNEPEKDPNERGAGKSVLDKDPEAKAMLEMMGKTRASEGHREEKSEDD